MDWHKVPEVMTGGKQYFYNCRIGGRKKYSVVWGRVKKKWLLIEYSDGPEKVLGEFETEKTAMKKAGDYEQENQMHMKSLSQAQVRMLNDVARERSLYVEGAMSHGKITRVKNVKGVTVLMTTGYQGPTSIGYDGQRFTDGYGRQVLP